MKATALLAIVSLMSGVTFAAEYCDSQDYDYWTVTKTTIVEIEEKDNKRTESAIRAMQNVPLNTFFAGRPATQAEKDNAINIVKSRSITNNPEWRTLKSKFQGGDELYVYMAPPLSGPIVYCLKRSNITIAEFLYAVQ